MNRNLNKKENPSSRSVGNCKTTHSEKDFRDLIYMWVKNDISYEMLKREFKQREDSFPANEFFEEINR